MLDPSMLQDVDAHEDRLVAHFVGHRVFGGMTKMTRAEILAILLQRRFLSLGFTPFYEMAMDGLIDRASQACAREILREEYGTGDRPTHRQDLMQDLLALGATRDEILGSFASEPTLQALARMFALLRKSEGEPLYQIKVLTALRLAGEVLVAAEYDRYWPHLRRLGLRAGNERGGVQSVFYYPHLCHDERRQRFGGEPDEFAARTHSDQLAHCLRSCLVAGPPEGIGYSISAATAAADIKRSFYDQF
jgi:hypothetical protein